MCNSIRTSLIEPFDANESSAVLILHNVPAGPLHGAGTASGSCVRHQAQLSCFAALPHDHCIAVLRPYCYCWVGLSKHHDGRRSELLLPALRQQPPLQCRHNEHTTIMLRRHLSLGKHST